MLLEMITFRINPGMEQEFETFNERIRETLCRVDGFVSHQIGRSESEPDCYIIWIGWLSKNARFIFEKHSTPNYKTLFKEGEKYFQEKPTHQLFTILDTQARVK